MAKKKAKTKKKKAARKAAGYKPAAAYKPVGVGAVRRALKAMSNPGRKLKRSQSTGWMPARRVKIIRGRSGQPDRVLIEKPPRKRRKKVRKGK